MPATYSHYNKSMENLIRTKSKLTCDVFERPSKRQKNNVCSDHVVYCVVRGWDEKSKAENDVLARKVATVYNACAVVREPSSTVPIDYDDNFFIDECTLEYNEQHFTSCYNIACLPLHDDVQCSIDNTEIPLEVTSIQSPSIALPCENKGFEHKQSTSSRAVMNSIEDITSRLKIKSLMKELASSKKLLDVAQNNATWNLFQQKIQAFVSDRQMKIVVRNFSSELMLGIQYVRGSIFCLAQFISKAGINLYHYGYVSDALKLYDNFLIKLICIAIDANNKSKAIQYENEKKTEQSCFLKSLYDASLSTFLIDYPSVAATLYRRGNTYWPFDCIGATLVYLGRGNKANEELLQMCYTGIIETLMNTALIYRRQGNYSMALTKYIQVYFVQVRAFGVHSMPVATSLSLIGLMQYRLKQYSSAYEIYQESVTIQIDLLGEENLGVASTINSLGLCCFYLRIFDHAKRFFMRSLRIRSKLLGSNHNDLAIIWYNLGTICVETGDEAEALKCYKESLRIEELTLDVKKSEGAVLTLQNLGYIYQRNGEIDDAGYHFRKALDLLLMKNEDTTDAVGKLYNLLGNIHLQKGEVAKMMEYYTNAARNYQRKNETMVISGYTFYCLSKLHPQGANAA